MAAGAFESSSGIPFLSLPNMGGFVREQEAERGTPLMMSQLWNSEPHNDWKFTGRNVRNARITEMLFPHAFVNFFSRTHALCTDTHTYT